MAKIIKLTSDNISTICDELSKYRIYDGKLSFANILTDIKVRAKVVFSEVAWFKMNMLINEFDKEVAWHGLVRKVEEDNDEYYYIYDILVYPQEVTGATVNTDQWEYEKWLMDFEDDVFNNIRMQGHSHVNMSVTPSSVDNQLYENFLDKLDDDMFYIFMIWNKKGDKTVKIYDMAKNLFFDTSDCDVEIESDFVKSAKDMVKTKTWATSTTTATSTSSTTKKTATTAVSSKKEDKKSASYKPKKAKKKDKGWDFYDDDEWDYKNYYRSAYYY